MRTVLGIACRSYAGRRHARRAREQRRPALHRDLEFGFHPVQRQRRRKLWAASATSRRYRNGFGAHHRNHSRHKKLHRVLRHSLELRDRHLSPDLRRAGKTERQEIRVDPSRNMELLAKAIRKRSTSPSALSPITSATLSFAIADGIIPSNEGRGYVLRRILRRAVRYGRTLGFHEPFFFKLVDVVAKTMGDVFPEVRAKADNDQRNNSAAKKRHLTRRSIVEWSSLTKRR